MIQVQLRADVPPHAFAKVLEYIYTGATSVGPEEEFGDLGVLAKIAAALKLQPLADLVLGVRPRFAGPPAVQFAGAEASLPSFVEVLSLPSGARTDLGIAYQGLLS